MAELLTSRVEKMFPVSFDRTGKYDRVLSEANIIDWIRGIVPDSVDTLTNSTHSYVIGMDENHIEFILNGYYVKLSKQWLNDIPSDILSDNTKTFEVYAKIHVSDPKSDSFRRLTGSEESNFFTALILDLKADGNIVYTTEDVPGSYDDEYILKILKRPAGNSDFVIPEESRSILDTSAALWHDIDGGEIE